MGFGTGPLVVQLNKTVLLEVDNPEADVARVALALLAGLERAPEHVHTYHITPPALWNTRAIGHDVEQVVDILERFSRSPAPQPLFIDVTETTGRYGRLSLTRHPVHGLILVSHDPTVLIEVTKHKRIRPILGEQIDANTWTAHPSKRDRIRQELLKVG